VDWVGELNLPSWLRKTGAEKGVQQKRTGSPVDAGLLLRVIPFEVSRTRYDFV